MNPPRPPTGAAASALRPYRHYQRKAVDGLVTKLLRSKGADPIRSRGAGVRIALLDTWPMAPGVPDPLEVIREFAHGLDGSGKNHQLLDRFARGEVVAMHRFRDYVTQSSLQEICSHGRDCAGHYQPEYRISDHGLFVADILDNIAPRAEIAVYRVLNDFGVLHFYSLARAIEQAIYDANGHNLVFNLSLGFAPELCMVKQLLQDPLESYDDPDKWGKRCVDEAKGGRNQLKEQEALNEPAMKPLKFLFSFDCEPLQNTVFAAAAAGNDSCSGGGLHVAPRFPAAIPGVLSVAALNRRREAASYSNEDDVLDPLDEGVSAYGGEIDRGTDTNKRDAPIGLYIADNLRGGANEYGFASWSGTSFATPVVTGLAASLLSEPRASLNAHQVRELLINAADGSATFGVTPDAQPRTIPLRPE